MITNISELNPSDYNPRKISERAIEGLKYSLVEFGDISGIVYNQRTKNLVAGHQRVRALREKFGNSLVVIDNKIITPDKKEFCIRIVDWTIEKEKAANIAANSEMLQGEFTSDIEKVIEEIKLVMPDLSNHLLLNEIIIPLDPIKIKPADIKEQGKLDEYVKIKCPKCGCEFERK